MTFLATALPFLFFALLAGSSAVFNIAAYVYGVVILFLVILSSDLYQCFVVFSLSLSLSLQSCHSLTYSSLAVSQPRLWMRSMYQQLTIFSLLTLFGCFAVHIFSEAFFLSTQDASRSFGSSPFFIAAICMPFFSGDIWWSTRTWNALKSSEFSRSASKNASGLLDASVIVCQAKILIMTIVESSSDSIPD